ncbi:hypothetical protein [Saccharothrix xinjiangensis]|uniref:Antitoxin protein of toxin-antitoxin system n=1 Tax=Saccharothrix xinjiangensis TaxID=204798 RepID=A0ABV9XSZ1_9PSEU
MGFINSKVKQAMDASARGDAKGVEQAFNELLAENDKTPRETLRQVHDLVMRDDKK